MQSPATVQIPVVVQGFATVQSPTVARSSSGYVTEKVDEEENFELYESDSSSSESDDEPKQELEEENEEGISKGKERELEKENGMIIIPAIRKS
jgi:hypothetical protein